MSQLLPAGSRCKSLVMWKINEPTSKSAMAKLAYNLLLG